MRHAIRLPAITLLATTLLTLTTSAALACPVCFGEADTAPAHGLYLATVAY